ncbi:putative Centromere/kinetochore protein zw10-like protein [Hypsibius exemplaris]|uniref:Centromere/kinetochore protein zw10-like protein n=1 Tax=Hypsibius exemplaris TaxID=2072580 RepID=A0A9X6NC78_HYPEX|nr:putative Centromere/kinetochore protein zw10-like protein [Hypsibius exemplaris]
MIPDSAVLDRATINTLSTTIAREQEILVKTLAKTSSPPTSSDYEAWFRIRTDIAASSSRLEELIEKADKNQPRDSKNESEAAQIALSEATETHRILSILRDVCRALEGLKAGFGLASSLEKDAKILIDLRKTLKDFGREERCGLKVVSSLKAQRTELQSALAVRVEQDWKELIDVTAAGIHLLNDVSFSSRLKDLIAASKNLQIFSTITKDLADRIFRQVVAPVANGKAGFVILEGEEISLQVINQPDVFPLEISAVTRLSEIRLCFLFLKRNVFKMDAETNGELAGALGRAMEAELVEAVQRNCIEDSLPADFAEFQAVKVDIVKGVAELKAVLAELNCMNPVGGNWEVDVGSLETVYAAKSGRELLIRSRHLLMSERDFLTPHKIASLAKSPADEGDDFALFQLQDMSVSTCVVTIMDHGRQLLERASSAASLRSLVTAVYNSSSMLLDIVPYSFQQKLISIPSAGVLFFTSCMYTSYQLHICNRIVQRCVASSGALDLSDDTNWNVSFLDLIIRLRSKAFEVLNAVSEFFAKEVLDVINDGQTTLVSGLMTKLAQSQLKNLLDQSALKRGLDVVNKLAACWREILPPIVFQQTIGVLVDRILVDSTNRVVSVEDINASDSTKLCENFRWLLAQAAESLKFGDASAETAPFKHVSSWMRFSEIIFILDASMSQIGERWADGNGPLAEHLSPDELKKMIRGLFENNDRRAKLLACIH